MDKNTVIFSIPATLTKLTSRADRSYKIEFVTQEMSATDVAAASSMLHSFGTLALVSNENAPDDVFSDIETPEMVLEQGEKSPSSRLRAVLFVLWKQKGTTNSFETFYKEWLEIIINQLKAKLPPQ